MHWFHTSRTQPHSAAIVGISFCSRLLDLFGGKNLTDSGASRDPYRSQLITSFVLPSRLVVVVVASRVKLVRYRRWTHTMRLFWDACSLPKFVWLRLFQSPQAYHILFFQVVFSWLAGLCPCGVHSIWVVTEHCTFFFFVLIQWYAARVFEKKKHIILLLQRP